MKPRWILGLCCLLVFSLLLGGCGGGVPDVSSTSLAPITASMPEQPTAGAEIAVLATEATAAGTYGQNVWTTVSRVAGEAAMTSGLYRAGDGETKAALASLELAVKGGAKLVVLAGEDLSDMAGQAQLLYPDIQFILLGMPYDTTPAANAVHVRSTPEQAGYLAGYATTYEEAGNIGFIASEDEEARRYALGFLLGADDAAEELLLDEQSLRAYPIALDMPKNEWAGVFRSWFGEEGPHMDLLFVNDAACTRQATQAAGEIGGALVLTQPSETPLGEALASSILFDPQNILANLLSSWLEERFPAGETLEGTVAGGEIGITLPREGLSRFTEQRYQTLLDQFRLGRLDTQLALKTAPNEEGELPLPEDLPLDYFVVGLPTEGTRPAVQSSVSSSAAVSEPTSPPPDNAPAENAPPDDTAAAPADDQSEKPAEEESTPADSVPPEAA